jgi:hypothetical protein
MLRNGASVSPEISCQILIPTRRWTSCAKQLFQRLVTGYIREQMMMCSCWRVFAGGEPRASRRRCALPLPGG